MNRHELIADIREYALTDALSEPRWFADECAWMLENLPEGGRVDWEPVRPTGSFDREIPRECMTDAEFAERSKLRAVIYKLA